MAPPRYQRGFSFSGFQANQPKASLPGQRVDIELDAIAERLKTAGASAYELAVLNGFVGTETDYLASLKGANGQNGTGEVAPLAAALTFQDVRAPAVMSVTSMLKATGVLSLAHLGCIGDTASAAQKTINTNALSTALDDATVRQILIPPGYFYYNPIAAKTINRGLQISGCGAANSQLWLDSDQSGLVLTQQDQLRQITVNGFTMANASTTGSGAALAISYPTTPAGTFPTVRIFDFATIGIDVFNHAWGSAIALSQCWNAKLGDLHLRGAAGVGKARLMKNGIIGTNCTGISISRFKIYSSTEGVVLGGGPSPAADTIDEGFQITDFEIVDVNRGIYHATAVAHAGNGVHNGHINAEQTAIDLYAKHSTEISDVALYKLTNSIKNWTGIQMANCNGNHIHDILFVDSSTTNTGANFGILLGNSSDNTVHHLRNVGTFPGGAIVAVGAGSDDNEISHIKASRQAGVSAVAVLGGAGLYNQFSDISPSAFVPLLANTATPSIANDLFGAFKTANTSATTITNFTNGYGVRRFQLLINDANTTLQHNGNLLLKGAVNVTPPSGAILTFALDGSTWREVARNF